MRDSAVKHHVAFILAVIREEFVPFPSTRVGISLASSVKDQKTTK